MKAARDGEDVRAEEAREGLQDLDSWWEYRNSKIKEVGMSGGEADVGEFTRMV